MGLGEPEACPKIDPIPAQTANRLLQILPMPRAMTRQHRSRIISFRVTADELDELISACTTSDARSLSDFARHAALDLARTRKPTAPGLDNTLARLNSTLNQITRLLDRSS